MYLCDISTAAIPDSNAKNTSERCEEPYEVACVSVCPLRPPGDTHLVGRYRAYRPWGRTHRSRAERFGVRLVREVVALCGHAPTFVYIHLHNSQEVASNTPDAIHAFGHIGSPRRKVA